MNKLLEREALIKLLIANLVGTTRFVIVFVSGDKFMQILNDNMQMNIFFLIWNFLSF